ncbi:MAG TPA: hypothetical protein VLM38_21895 [Blastocatellia bacterium]|nr:hypothetical protein [Blastocatellia bacterium]
MKRFMIHIGLSLAIALGAAAPASPAKQTRAHRAAMRICKQRYKDAMRGARYLRGHDRRARRAQARKDREECERLAPK